jgi:hypothetical protein
MVKKEKRGTHTELGEEGPGRGDGFALGPALLYCEFMRSDNSICLRKRVKK